MAYSVETDKAPFCKMDKALAIKHCFDSVFLFNVIQRLAKNIFQRV